MELCFTVLSINMENGSGQTEDGRVLEILRNCQTMSESYYNRTVLVSLNTCYSRTVLVSLHTYYSRTILASLHPDQFLMLLVFSVSATGECVCVFCLLLSEDQHPAISSFAYLRCFCLPTPCGTNFPTVFGEF